MIAGHQSLQRQEQDPAADPARHVDLPDGTGGSVTATLDRDIRRVPTRSPGAGWSGIGPDAVIDHPLQRGDLRQRCGRTLESETTASADPFVFDVDIVVDLCHARDTRGGAAGRISLEPGVYLAFQVHFTAYR